jgi:hypothetical protein
MTDSHSSRQTGSGLDVPTVNHSAQRLRLASHSSQHRSKLSPQHRSYNWSPQPSSEQFVWNRGKNGSLSHHTKRCAIDVVFRRVRDARVRKRSIMSNLKQALHSCVSPLIAPGDIPIPYSQHKVCSGSRNPCSHLLCPASVRLPALLC